MIELEDLCVSVGGFRLDKVCLSVRKAEYLVLLGPSGAGKTMLLEAIPGISSADSGKILIDGKEVQDLPPEDRKAALVYQDYSLFPHLTVADNIAYGMKMQGCDPRASSERVERLLSDFGISGLRDRYPCS